MSKKGTTFTTSEFGRRLPSMAVFSRKSNLVSTLHWIGLYFKIYIERTIPLDLKI